MRKIIRFKKVLASLNNVLKLEARPPEVAPDFILFSRIFLVKIDLRKFSRGEKKVF